jgi:hypothetical protein
MHDHEHDHNDSHSHAHEHTHSHEHTHTHDHEHTHAHTHEHTHDGSHDHDQAHDHGHEHVHGHTHGEDDHGDLLKSKKEAAAFLRYTLQHNAHHEEELDGLVHSLRHLALDKEADEIASCIGALKKVNDRLDAVLATLM